MSVFCELQVKLAAGHKFDRDVELLIYYKDAHQPTAVVEAGQASAKPGECKVVKGVTLQMKQTDVMC